MSAVFSTRLRPPDIAWANAPSAWRSGIDFAEFNLRSVRRPAIYINCFFALLLMAIVPIRALAEDMPSFPSIYSAILEWGVMVPCCIASIYLRSGTHSVTVIERWSVILVSLCLSAMLVDLMIWQRSGMSLPHEYAALMFVGLVSTCGFGLLTLIGVSIFFVTISCVLIFHGGGTGSTAAMHIYSDISAVGITMVIEMARRSEARRAWQLQSQLDVLAFMDPLTSLANRRYLEQHVATVFGQARRDQKSISLAIVDLDNFKALNDTHGHDAGDEALKMVARCLEGVTRRPMDLAARVGGDEFLAIWFDIDAEASRDRCRALLDAIGQARITNDGSEGGVLKASIGVINGMPQADGDYDRFRRHADHELYRSKRGKTGSRFFVTEI